MTTVLVIEDSPSEMARFRDLLAKNNFRVLEAANGEQGCSMATKYLPDVILMDVVMPEMNGFQATRKITRDHLTAHIPVVIISTKNQESDKLWGKRQAAREYLTKPIVESELIAIIRSVTE
jgi:twitching motility two-component system response regulator PilH